MVVLVEENHGYSSVIGSAEMPYLNSLANQYGVATQYFANAHPSIGDYFMLTVGDTITNDNSFTGTVANDNVVRRLAAAGKTWKSYAESLPAAGYLGPDVPPYVKRHNPFPYLSDVVNDTAQAQNVVPFSALVTDLAAGQLPNFAFIVPNLNNDAHQGSLAQADSWLKTNIDPLVTDGTFRASGVLMIVFDESDFGDTQNGGGHVAAVIVTAKAKPGYRSTTFYQHQSTLRLILEALGIAQLPGAAATAPAMSEFFQ